MVSQSVKSVMFMFGSLVLAPFTYGQQGPGMLPPNVHQQRPPQTVHPLHPPAHPLPGQHPLPRGPHHRFQPPHQPPQSSWHHRGEPQHPTRPPWHHRRPGHHPPGVIVIDRPYRHPLPPRYHHFYHRHHLPDGVKLAILAGVTYAIIDDLYYFRQQGNGYAFVAQPPRGEYQLVEEKTDNEDLAPGTLVTALPAKVKKVIYNHQVYLVAGNTWFLPVKGTSTGQYVVVENPID